MGENPGRPVGQGQGTALFFEFASEDPGNPGNDPGLSDYDRINEYRRETENWNRQNFTFGESARLFGERGEAARSRVEKFVRLAWGRQDVSVADLSRVVLAAAEGRFNGQDRAHVFVEILRGAGVRIALREEVFDASYRTYANTLASDAERKAAEADVLENYKKFGIAVIPLSTVEEALAKGPVLQEKGELRAVLKTIGVERVVDSSEPTFFASEGIVESVRRYFLEPYYESQRALNFERAAERAGTLEERARFEEAAGNARFAAGLSTLDKVLWAATIYGVRVPKLSPAEVRLSALEEASRVRIDSQIAAEAATRRTAALEAAMAKGNHGTITVIEAGAGVSAEADFLAGGWRLGNFSQGTLPGQNVRFVGGGGAAGGAGPAIMEGGGLSRTPSAAPKPPVYSAASETGPAAAAQPARPRLVSPEAEKIPVKAPGRDAPHQVEPKPSDSLRISNPQPGSFGVPIVDPKGNPSPISNPDPKSGETMRVSGAALPHTDELMAAARNLGILDRPDGISSEKLIELLQALQAAKVAPVISPERLRALSAENPAAARSEFLKAILRRETPTPAEATGRANFINFAQLRAESDRIAAARTVLSEPWAIETYRDIQKDVILADDNFGRKEEFLRVVDHHFPYVNTEKNATMLLLDLFEDALRKVGGEAAVARPTDEQVSAAVALLNIREIATTNAADGGKCAFIAGNQARVLKSTALREFLRNATRFEDYTAFKPTELPRPEKLEAWARNNPEIAYQLAVFQRYSEILSAHGVSGSDRFPAEKSEAVLAELAQAEAELLPSDRDLSRLPRATLEKAAEFLEDLERAKEILQDPRVRVYDDGRTAVFDLAVLKGIYKETHGREIPIFAQWLAVPRAHDRNVQITDNRGVIVVGIPAPLPSGKGIDTILPALREAEAAAGGDPSKWGGKDIVVFNFTGSKLKAETVLAIVNDPAHGLFERPLDPWMLDTLEPGQMVFANGGEKPFREIKDGRVYFDESSGVGSVSVAEFRAENFGELPVASIRPTENGLSSVRLQGAKRFLDKPVRIYRHIGPDGKATDYALDGHHRLAVASAEGTPAIRVRFEPHDLGSVRERIAKGGKPQFPVPGSVAELRVDTGRIDDYQGTAVASALETTEVAFQWAEAKILEVLDGIALPPALMDTLRAEFQGYLMDLLEAHGKGALEELDDGTRETVARKFVLRVETRLDEVLGGSL